MKREGFVILDFDCLLLQYTLHNWKVYLFVFLFLLEIEQYIVPFYDLQYVHVHRT